MDVLSYVRMPLFTFLSGVVYAYRPVNMDNIPLYIKGKFNRILIPMFIIGTAYAVIRNLTPGVNNTDYSMYNMHIYPVGYFWFLESIFIIFMVLILLEKFKFLDSLNSSIYVILFFSLINPYFVNVEIFSINGFFYLMPYFLLGVIVSRYRDYVDTLLENKNVLIMGSVLILFLSLHFFEVIDIGSKRTSYLALIIGSLSCLFLYGCRFQSKILASIGIYSYTIYLYHGFLTSGARVVLNRLYGIPTPVVIAIGFSAGILLPIVLDKLFSRNRITSFYLLGRRLKVKVTS